jgi:hypothetical protein
MRQRFQFLDHFKLTANWDDEEFTLFWREKSVPWQYGRLYVIAKGKTLTEATDAAIERWEKKHKRKFEGIAPPINSEFYLARRTGL